MKRGFKKFFKSSLSVVLAITIIFSPVVVGFSEVDFGVGIADLNINKDSVDFRSIYKFFETYGFNSSLAVKATAADYSNLTPNEYITRVLLNYNYNGELNDYGTLGYTRQQEIFENIYYKPSTASSARVFYNEFKNAEGFQTTKSLYRALTFDFSSAVEESLNEEDYYSAIILSILDAKFQDDNYIDSVNCTTNKNILTSTKSVADILKSNASYDVSNLSKIRISMLTDDEVSYIAKELAKSTNHKNLYNMVGKNLSWISDIIYAADTVNDAIKSICAYTSLADTSVAVKNVLYEMYLNCPSDNTSLRNAASKVYQYVSKQMSDDVLAMITAKEAANKVGTKLLLSSLWEELWLSVPWGIGIVVGQAAGKAIANYCFATDAKLEQLYVLGCVVEVEDVILSTVNALANDYKNNPNSSNADNFIKSLEFLLSVYALGHSYSRDFMTTVYTEGAVSKIKYSGDGVLQDYIDSSNAREANLPWYLIRFPHYAPFYKIDAPSGYNYYFGGSGSQYEDDTEEIKAEYITLNKTSVDLALNTRETLTATVYPSNVPHADLISFTSSDESVVEVDVVEGVLTPVGPGTAEITVIGPDVVMTTCKVTVLPYRLLKNDTGFSIKEYVGNSTKISIPEKISDFHINGIDSSVFKNHTELKKVTIPKSIINIGNSVFEGCTNLATVTIANGVENIGDSVFSGCESLASVTIPSSVISIGDFAFYNCNKFSSVSLSNNIISIGNGAFQGCTSLKSITIPDSVISMGESTFAFCSNLSSVKIGNNITEIGDSAFWYCINLESIIIPDSVTDIGNSAFYHCENLVSIKVSKSLKTIGESAFAYCLNLGTISLPNGVTRLNQSTFHFCKSLVTIIIPESVDYIDSSCLRGCLNLERVYWNAINVQDFTSSSGLFNGVGVIGGGINIVFGDTVKKIPAYLCYVSSLSSRPNIKSVTIGSNVTNIGNSAFNGCENLEKVYWNATNVQDFTYSSEIFCGAGVSGLGIDIVFGDTVKKIPAYLCYVSSSSSRINIKSVTIGNSVASIGSSAFYNCKSLNAVHITDLDAWFSIEFNDNPLEYAGNLYLNGNLVTHVDVPASITEIPMNIFYGCTSLKSVNIPKNIRTIGENAFSNCISLTNVNVSAGLEYIGDSAFYECGSLTNINIPDTVTYIGSGAFAWCDKLSNIYIGPNVKEIGLAAFGRCVSVENINVSVDNKYYSSKDGVLFNKDKTKLICYPAGKNGETYTIPNSVKEIDYAAFLENQCIESISVPDTVKMLGYASFGECPNLKTVDIGNGVTEIPGAAFLCCSNLSSITMSNNIESIGDDAFALCTSLKMISVPDSVSSIGDDAFEGCINLSRIDLPYNLETIGDYAFSDCEKIQTVTIPGKVTSIGRRAFDGCTNLESVLIPASVTEIGEYAFDSCPNFTTVFGEKYSIAETFAENEKLIFVPLNIAAINNKIASVDYLSKRIVVDSLRLSNLADLLNYEESTIITLGNNFDGQYIGTGTDIIVTDIKYGDFTFDCVVKNDTTGDGICDVLDCAQVERASNGNANLSEVYAMAADSNSDEVVDIVDYQAIVNKALVS